MPSIPPLASATTGSNSNNSSNNNNNNTSLGNQGLRRVSHLFKALSSSSDENVRHPSFLSESTTNDKRWQRFGGHIQQLRLSKEQLEQVVYDPAQFHKIQQVLRDRHGQTNALAKQIAPQLIRECLAELRRDELVIVAELEREQLAMREEQRKLSIQRELTEARIKARQALNISLDSKGEAVDDDEDATNNNNDNDNSDNNSLDEPGSPNGTPKSSSSLNSSDESPTSVTKSVLMSDEHFLAFKPGLVVEEESSEDGDIQEVEDE